MEKGEVMTDFPLLVSLPLIGIQAPAFVLFFLLVFFLPFKFAKRPELTPPLATEEELKLAKGEELYNRTEVGRSGDMID